MEVYPPHRQDNQLRFAPGGAKTAAGSELEGGPEQRTLAMDTGASPRICRSGAAVILQEGAVISVDNVVDSKDTDRFVRLIMSSAYWSYKNVMVVEEDIDIRDYEQLDWAFAYRVNAGENDIVTFPGTFGSLLDPSTNLSERDALRYGSGKWTRVLIDATRNWEFPRWEAWNNSVYPPIIVLNKELETRVKSRWHEYGLGDIVYKPTMRIDLDEDIKQRYSLSARPTPEKEK